MTTYSPASPVLSEQRPEISPASPAYRRWAALYRISGAAALISVGCIIAAVGVFLISPPPSTISAHFALLQSNPFLGLLDLDLLMLVTYGALLAFYPGLYVALRRVSPSFMAVALTLGLVSVTTYITTNPAFAMLSLSGQYASATTVEQKSAALAAGEAVYASSVGTAFDVSYILGGIAILIIATVMLRSGSFGRPTGYAGLAMGILMLVPATAGTIGLYLSLASLVPTTIWLVLVARRLFQLASSTEEDSSVTAAGA